jgi:hypothetical protein
MTFRPAGTRVSTRKDDEPMTGSMMTDAPRHGRLRTPHLRLLALGVGLAAAAVVTGWLVLGGGDDTAKVGGTGPTLASQAQLEQLARETDHPVYWAGPKDGYRYELTRTSDGRIYIRYLPEGVTAGDPRADYLVVGTYERSGSFAGLRRAAKRQNAVSLRLDDEGLMVFDSKRPTSVYFGYPAAKYQVEVYAPSGETARRAVLTRKITPIE